MIATNNDAMQLSFDQGFGQVSETDASKTNPPPVVFVIDDHPGMRKSLCYLIEAAGLTAEPYETARDFLDNYDAARRGCLVLDMRMPGVTGLDLLDELASRGDARPAIMITGFGSVPTAVRAMKAGAIDFLEKPFDDDELLERIQQGLQLDAMWRDWQNKSIDIVGRLASLTPREREVLDLIIDGRRNREIADSLGVSIGTVADHRQRVMRKMNARTALDLVRMVSMCRTSSTAQ
jgi:two-component system, LuxR family, response regulator FixJ